MTVTVETARVRYAGDGVTTHFPVPWYFLEETDLRVVWRDPAGVEFGQLVNFDFFVTGAGNPAGGAIDLVFVLPVGWFLAISRNEVVKQEADYITTDSFPSTSSSPIFTMFESS